MAGVGYVKGKRKNDDNSDFFAVATQSGDWIYFLEDKQYRCRTDFTRLQTFNKRNLYWINTDEITNLSGITFDPESIIAGGGSVAPDGSMESVVQWCINTANDPSHGYDQRNRTGPDYDCSSFISAGLMAAGYDVPYMTTYTMRSVLEPLGWTWLAGQGNSASGLMRGDILLCVSSHVELYIGNNQNVGAHSNEFGGIVGGQPGDQTGNEISITGWYAFPWDGVLRKGA